LQKNDNRKDAKAQSKLLLNYAKQMTPTKGRQMTIELHKANSSQPKWKQKRLGKTPNLFYILYFVGFNNFRQQVGVRYHQVFVTFKFQLCS